MTKTRIALFSDTHLWPGAEQRFGNANSQMQPWSSEIRDVLLADLASSRPDLLFHLGDLTCGGGSFAMPDDLFYTTLRDFVAQLNRLPGAFYGLPGNHDAPLGQPWTFAEEQLGLAPGQGHTLDTPHARLILLNAQGHDQAQIDAAAPNDPVSGFVAAHELARLERDLAGAADRPVLLFMHQLLQPWAGDQPWADLYGVENGSAVRDLLARHGNVRAVFQAHAHRLDLQPVTLGAGTCWFVVLPAVIEYPMAWMELVLDEEHAHLTMRRLPLRDLAEQSRRSGDIDWRAGRPEWRNARFPLRNL
ncbi:MAG: metallophosphoesterase [Caldilineaceae bacterium]|nr:metallophosphoesterase [Caldilineaceae bacterium]